MNEVSLFVSVVGGMRSGVGHLDRTLHTMPTQSVRSVRVLSLGAGRRTAGRLTEVARRHALPETPITVYRFTDGTDRFSALRRILDDEHNLARRLVFLGPRVGVKYPANFWSRVANPTAVLVSRMVADYLSAADERYLAAQRWFNPTADRRTAVRGGTLYPDPGCWSCETARVRMWEFPPVGVPTRAVGRILGEMTYGLKWRIQELPKHLASAPTIPPGDLSASPVRPWNEIKQKEVFSGG